MHKQSRLLDIPLFVLALILFVSGCAAAPTPTLTPTDAPTLVPTLPPTVPPTATQTLAPTATTMPTATTLPTATATKVPTTPPTLTPTDVPTAAPTSTASEAATPADALATAEATSLATNTGDTPNTAGGTAGVCLGCHGPFTELASKTSDYAGWPNGETTTPHRFVPHSSTDIPECILCHKPHAVPPQASDIEAMGKPEHQYCFSCHHAAVLKCGTCHQ